MTPAHLLLCFLFIKFNYSVSFIRGSHNSNVDCLSRAPLKVKTLMRDICLGNEINALYSEHILQICSVAITASAIATDPIVDLLLRRLQNELSDKLYTVSHGIIFYKNLCIFLPVSN